MRQIISGGLAAAALGTIMIVSGTLPATAQVARPISALAAGNSSGDLVTLARVRGGGGGAVRGGGSGRGAVRAGGGRGYAAPARAYRGVARAGAVRAARVQHRRWHNYRYTNWRWRNRYVYRGYWPGYWGVGIGLGVPYYTYGSGYYGDYYADAVDYCMSRFRSYDPVSRTYLGYDGRRHPCP
jgi:hypothetical protein